ncbi:MAG: GNAT family N-acetyltransferase [Planctomycetota bacterium]|jgi:RimJ/RimL family protein N-acetyltransferase
MDTGKRVFPYRVETPRMVLRCWNPEDAPLLKAASDASREHLLPWMPWAAGEPQTIEEFAERLRLFRARFDRDEDHIYGAFSPDESTVLGGTGLHDRVGKDARETGYWIHVDHVRQGLATEMAAAMTRVAFDILHLDRMEIRCDTRNEASAAIPKNLGYTREAELRRRSPTIGDEPGDLLVFTLFASDFPETPSARLEIRAFDVLGGRLL